MPSRARPAEGSAGPPRASLRPPRPRQQCHLWERGSPRLSQRRVPACGFQDVPAGSGPSLRAAAPSSADMLSGARRLHPLWLSRCPPGQWRGTGAGRTSCWGYKPAVTTSLHRGSLLGSFRYRVQQVATGGSQRKPRGSPATPQPPAAGRPGCLSIAGCRARYFLSDPPTLSWGNSECQQRSFWKSVWTTHTNTTAPTLPCAPKSHS